MSVIARRAELVKIGRVLGVTPAELAPITPDDVGSLRALRDAMSAALFDDVRPSLTRVARGSRLLPTSLVARIGEAAFGALLCARIASLLAPKHALEVALHMPDAFLADVSAQLDPRSAGAVVALIPTDRVVRVAAVLVARRDYVTMGRFVDDLSHATLAAVIESIPDELDLLHIATFVESPAKLDELVGMLPEARLRAMIARLSQGDGELWLEILAIAHALAPAWLRTIGDLAAAHDTAVLEALVAAARRHELWASALPLVLAMGPASAHRFLALPSVDDLEVLGAIVSAADELDRWPDLLPFAGQMTPGMRTRLALVVQDRPRALFERIVIAARAPAVWPPLLAIAAEMHEPAQQRLAELVGHSADMLRGPLAEAVQQAPLWEALLPLVVRLPVERRSSLLATVLDANTLAPATQLALLSALLQAADRLGHLAEVGTLVDQLPAHLRDRLAVR